MGNDGNEYKIITQVFLYKFLNDKFGYALKTSKSPYAAKIRKAEKWEVAYSQLTDMDRMMLLASLSLLKTEDIHPPKTGISVHLSSSLGERNRKTSFFSRVPNRYHSIYSPSSYSSSKCFTHGS